MITTWSGNSPMDAPVDLREALVRTDSPGETTYFVIADASGKVQGAIPGGTQFFRDPSAVTGYVRQQLQQALAYLKLPPSTAPLRPVRLPTVASPRTESGVPAGVRLFIRLPEHAHPAYRVPVVDALALTPSDWGALRYPTQARSVPVEALRPWLEWVYPVGMKEMVGANIRNDTLTGTLTLRPLGTDSQYRYALLSGKVELVLAGRSRVTHSGTLRGWVTYPKKGSGLVAFRALLETVYPESDPWQNIITRHPVRTVVESV